MRAVDTNIVVRVLVRDDAHQTVVADKFIEGGAWISVLALVETVWVLRTVYKFRSTELATSISMLLRHRDFVLQDSEAVAQALELFRARPSLGFSDCLMLALARKAGHLPLGTFDRNLSRAEGAQKI
jgi:predicted nucleic-acid-binding protein